ncbi:MAG TPA: WXG100 family type VII secretion target [Candidatus Dormibacteraeota bacterium]|jgi:WXG100 family type VII secretion target
MPDQGHVLVTFGSLAEAAADVDAIANQIDQQLADLRAYLAPLVASWEGVASADYQAKQQRWDGALGDLNLVLREMARAVRTANDNYQLAESSNAAMWG